MGDHTDATEEASRDSDDPDCDRYERCAVCGVMVDTTEWHRVRASFDTGVRIDTICSEECCEQWEADDWDPSNDGWTPSNDGWTPSNDDWDPSNDDWDPSNDDLDDSEADDWDGSG